MVPSGCALFLLVGTIVYPPIRTTVMFLGRRILPNIADIVADIVLAFGCAGCSVSFLLRGLLHRRRRGRDRLQRGIPIEPAQRALRQERAATN